VAALMEEKNIILTYLVSLVIFFCVYATWDVLQPFIIGFLLAYLLFPLEVILRKYTGHKIISIFFVLSVFLIVMVTLGLFFFQFIYNEFLDILSGMPPDTEKLLEFLGLKTNKGLNSIFDDLNKNFSFENVITKIISYFFVVLYKVLRGNFSILMEGFSFMFILPVSTVFFLFHMSHIDKVVEPLLPLVIYNPLKEFVVILNKNMKKFLYAQFLVGISQLIFYYIMFQNIHIIRIKFFLFIICLGSFIPSFGSLCGLFSFIIVSFIENTSFYDGLFIFTLGYVYENYALIPYFVGGELGISSFFIWCCVMIGGKLLGFIGFIFAIPVGAVFAQMYKNYRKDQKLSSDIEVS